MVPIVRKLFVAFEISRAASPASTAQAADLVALGPLKPTQAQETCAAIDNLSIPAETYVHACMAFYLNYLHGVPADMKAPFERNFEALRLAQKGIDTGAIGYDEYFARVSQHTCAVADEFRKRPLIDWALGEVLVGVAEMVQSMGDGNKRARIPMGAGSTFRGCPVLAVTS